MTTAHSPLEIAILQPQWQVIAHSIGVSYEHRINGWSEDPEASGWKIAASPASHIYQQRGEE